MKPKGKGTKNNLFRVNGKFKGIVAKKVPLVFLLETDKKHIVAITVYSVEARYIVTSCSLEMPMTVFGTLRSDSGTWNTLAIGEYVMVVPLLYIAKKENMRDTLQGNLTSAYREARTIQGAFFERMASNRSIRFTRDENIRLLNMILQRKDKEGGK
jgi:hypothetical protein